MRGTAAELAARFSEPPKGEITLVARAGERTSGGTSRRAAARPCPSSSPRACRAASRPSSSLGLTGVPRNTLYRRPCRHILTTSDAAATLPLSFTRSDNRRFAVRRVVLVAALLFLAVPSAACAWSWPADGPVLRAVRARLRPVRRRPAPRHRHRRARRRRRSRAPVAGTITLRRLAPGRRPGRDDHDGRRLRRHAAPARRRSRSTRGDAVSERDAVGTRRAERRRRDAGAARPPRRPRRRGASTAISIR